MKFLLGKLYEEITDKLYEMKINKATEYELLKNTYINEVYKHDESKVITYNLYIKNIFVYEVLLQKDLYKFNVLELNDLMTSIASSSINVKSNIYSFITQYLNWCISKRLITINNMNSLDKEECIKISQRLASNKFISKKQLWDMVRYMEIRTDVQNIVPIVLAYYCIPTKDMNNIRHLTLSDIDIENKRLYMANTGDCGGFIQVDKDFIYFIMKAHNEAINDDKYVVNNLLIKPTRRSFGEVVAENTVYNRIYQAYDDSGIRRIKLNNLAKSRKIDMLLEIRKHRYLSNKDFQDVCRLFNQDISVGYYDALVRLYVMATDDKVFKANASKEELVDVNVEENYRNIFKKLGW